MALVQRGRVGIAQRQRLLEVGESLGVGVQRTGVLAGLAQGQTPASVLGVFTISGEPNVLAGLLGHLGVAGVYGLV